MATRSSHTIRLGTASPATQATTSETLALIERITSRAAGLGVDLLLLPEAFIGGYPRGSTFGCAIGSRSSEGREEYRRYFRAAVDLGDTVGDGGAGAGIAWVRKELGPDGDVTAGANDNGGTDGTLVGTGGSRRGDGTRERLEDISRRTGVFLVVGCIERAGGSLYCAAVYVCPKLGIVGKRRKVMPTGSERLIWAQGSPATLRAVSTTIRGVRINMAAAICWESYMPLLRQALYAQNVNLYLAPTADGRDAWLSLMRTVGAEGRCFVVSSNMCVRSPADGARGRWAGASLDRDYGSTDNGAPAASSPPASMSPERSPMDMRRRRRESVITVEGFEIALPPLGDRPRTISPATTAAKSRRKSVLDEDGNEIVLCCNADDSNDGDAQCAAGAHGDGGGASTSAPAPAPAAAPAPRAAARSKVGAANSAGPEAFVSRGGSCITGPFGDVLAGPQWEDDEGILFADVDFEDCIRGRLDLDAGGSYSRNDSFKLSVEGLDLNPLPY